MEKLAIEGVKRLTDRDDPAIVNANHLLVEFDAAAVVNTKIAKSSLYLGMGDGTLIIMRTASRSDALALQKVIQGLSSI